MLESYQAKTVGHDSIAEHAEIANIDASHSEGAQPTNDAILTSAVTESGTNPYAPIHAILNESLENVIRIPGQPAWIILCGYAIGETAEFCGLAEAFVKEHGHGIVLVIMQKHADLAAMYAHRFLKVVTVLDNFMQALLRTDFIPQDRFELNQPLSACWIDRGFRQSDGIKYLGRYPERGGISETDMMRFVLRLPWNAKLEAPRIQSEWEDEAWQLAKQLGLRLGRSVLLCPINNSGRRFPDVFWRTVAERLNELGYKVFTNMGGLKPWNGPPTMPVEGTTPIDLPIRLVIPFANFAGRVISGANGMCFLIMLGCFDTFRMTQLVTVWKNEQVCHSSLGFKAPHPGKGTERMSAFQYSVPELCLRTSLNEFLLPDDESPSELMRLARIVAEQDTNDPTCIKRLSASGELYINEHRDWLKELT